MLILSVHDLFQVFLFLNLAQSQIAFEEVEMYHLNATCQFKASVAVHVSRYHYFEVDSFSPDSSRNLNTHDSFSLNCYLFCCLHTLETLESHRLICIDIHINRWLSSVGPWRTYAVGIDGMNIIDCGTHSQPKVELIYC